MKKPEVIAAIGTTIIVITILFFALGGRTTMSDIFPKNISIPEWLSFDKNESNKTTGKKRRSKGKVAPGTSKPIDSYKGVTVYDNGSVRNVHGRNTTSDGYNLGLRYQCVEFVKRFYYKDLKHKMPNSYGNAKEFFNYSVRDGKFNKARGLTQYTNGSNTKPHPKDILIWGSAPYNSFGHVAIISKVESNRIQIIQQNPGPGNPSREWLPLQNSGGKWKVNIPHVVGWLRK